MLHSLLDYGRRTGLASEPGFIAKDIKLALHFSSKGDYLNASPLGTGKSGKTFFAPSWSQGEMKALGHTAHFLADAASIVCNAADEKATAADRQKQTNKHEAFKRLLADAGEVEPTLKGISAQLDQAPVRHRILADLTALGGKLTDKVTLYINETPLLESTPLLDWWRTYRTVAVLAANVAKGKKVAASNLRVSIVDGQRIEPALTHGPIRGLAGIGGLPTGSMLACFDKEAFESYGLAQCENAALDSEAAAAYTAVLTHLAQKCSVRLGSSLFVHWYAREIPPEDDFIFALDAYTPEEQVAIDKAKADQSRVDAIALLRTVFTTKLPQIGNTRFYGMVIGASAARVRIKEYWESSLKATADQLLAWFEDAALDFPAHRQGAYLPGPRPRFFEVLQSLADVSNTQFDSYSDQLSAPLVTGMLDCALRGAVPPLEAVERATRLSLLWFHRREVDRYSKSNRLQAWRLGLIKLYHLRSGDRFMQPAVNPDHPSPAYHCGRLVSLLEDLQRAAQGQVNASIADRFLASAAQTPGLVLGQLNVGAHVHLRKLEGAGKGGLASWFRGRVAEANAHIGDRFPDALDLASQGLFSLGYWQQVADSERRKSAGKADATESTAKE
jgi:CRISPR-associated protein Csd1